MKPLFSIFFIMTLFTNCQQAENRVPVTTIPLPEKMLSNLSYGSDSMQRFDLYLPANRSAQTTNVLVLIHGGGWAGGDKAEFATSIPELQRRLPQYAIANINYRLANSRTNHFPTQEADIKAALEAILAKGNDYQISKNVVLLGTSAGAHLALLQAYKYDLPVVPKAVISFFGPTDLSEIYNRQNNSYYKMALQLLIGGTPAAIPLVYGQASPINFAGAHSIPTLLLHGAKDGLVPVSQSENLKAKLQKAGVPVEMVVYSTEGHGWAGASLSDSYTRIETFLKKFVPDTILLSR